MNLSLSSLSALVLALLGATAYTVDAYVSSRTAPTRPNARVCVPLTVGEIAVQGPCCERATREQTAGEQPAGGQATGAWIRPPAEAPDAIPQARAG